MKLGAVLFDFDGVIVDTEPIYDRLTRELLAELGVHPPPQLFDRLRGLRAADEWRLVASESFARDEDREYGFSFQTLERIPAAQAGGGR